MRPKGWRSLAFWEMDSTCEGGTVSSLLWLLVWVKRAASGFLLDVDVDGVVLLLGAKAAAVLVLMHIKRSNAKLAKRRRRPMNVMVGIALR